MILTVQKIIITQRFTGIASMTSNQAKIILFTSFLLVGFLGTPANAESLQLVISADHTTGYSRALFKHWIDADKDGCNTRAEVLIDEAITKPKVDSKCSLTGGKWLSTYDGKSVTKSSDLDVDHMVPLAEAWRSGAWKWSAAQRQSYANDLDDARALIAVTLSTNRSKGDKDPALWLPSIDQCTYTKNWIAIKIKYSLTVDTKEATKLNSLITSCGFGVPTTPITTPTVIATPTITTSATPTPVVTPTPVTTPSATPSVSPTSAPVSVVTPTPTPVVSTSSLIVTPGSFCTPAGAIGKSTSGVLYTCKTSPTDTRNRWRQ
jgi:hypothetical protein